MTCVMTASSITDDVWYKALVEAGEEPLPLTPDTWSKTAARIYAGIKNAMLEFGAERMDSPGLDVTNCAARPIIAGEITALSEDQDDKTAKDLTQLDVGGTMDLFTT